MSSASQQSRAPCAHSPPSVSLAVCSALLVTTKLISPDLVNALLPTVLERLHHPKEHVRKKAVLALLRFQQLDPRREGPLAGVDVDRHLRTMLCDKDPAVMSAALSALYTAIKQVGGGRWGVAREERGRESG